MIRIYLFNSQNMTIEALMDRVLNSVLLSFLTNAIMIKVYTFIFVKMQMNKNQSVHSARLFDKMMAAQFPVNSLTPQGSNGT